MAAAPAATAAPSVLWQRWCNCQLPLECCSAYTAEMSMDLDLEFFGQDLGFFGGFGLDLDLRFWPVPDLDLDLDLQIFLQLC